MPRVLLALILLTSANAHHSTAPYDMTREESVSGVVTSFYWANPHAHIYLDDPSGIQHWSLEIESPNLLRHQGWTKDTVKPGDQLSCKGARAKTQTNYAMKCFLVTLPDGRELHAQ